MSTTTALNEVGEGEWDEEHELEEVQGNVTRQGGSQGNVELACDEWENERQDSGPLTDSDRQALERIATADPEASLSQPIAMAKLSRVKAKRSACVTHLQRQTTSRKPRAK